MKKSLTLDGTPCTATSAATRIIQSVRNGARMQGITLKNDILPKSLREIVGSFLFCHNAKNSPRFMG